MKSIIKFMIWTLTIIVIIYALILTALYFKQESFLFQPTVLPQDYTFKFDHRFEEKFIETTDHIRLNCLLFKADSSRGVIFFLHGNAGALNSWSFVSDIYNESGYDFFILDYRGFGKSTGKIKSEKQLYDDVDQAYNMILKEYDENKVIIIGQSLGTGLATYLAAKYNPERLILISPYYSFAETINQNAPFVPVFLLKYKIPTNEYIKKVKAPISIFHGKNDKLINMEASVKLKKLCKPGDEIFLLENLGHNGINDNHVFLEKMREILKKE